MSSVPLIIYAIVSLHGNPVSWVNEDFGNMHQCQEFVKHDLLPGLMAGFSEKSVFIIEGRETRLYDVEVSCEIVETDSSFQQAMD